MLESKWRNTVAPSNIVSWFVGMAASVNNKTPIFNKWSVAPIVKTAPSFTLIRKRL